MDRRITKDYVAGFLENSGGFYVRNLHNRQYPTFIIRSGDQRKIQLISAVFDYLDIMGIKHFEYKNSQGIHSWSIANYSDMAKFMKFMKNNTVTYGRENFSDAEILLDSWKEKHKDFDKPKSL